MKKFEGKLDRKLIEKVVEQFKLNSEEHASYSEVEINLLNSFLDTLSELQDNDDYFELAVSQIRDKRDASKSKVFDYKVVAFRGDDTPYAETDSYPVSMETVEIIEKLCANLEVVASVVQSQCFYALTLLVDGDEDKRNDCLTFIQKTIKCFFTVECMEHEFSTTARGAYDDTCKLSLQETNENYWTAYVYAPKGNGIAFTQKISLLNIQFFIEDICSLLEKLTAYPQLIDLATKVERDIAKFFSNLKNSHMKKFEEHGFFFPTDLFEVFELE